MSDDKPTMVISGASGMIGTALTQFAEGRGWEVVPLVRDRKADGIYWSIDDESIDIERLEIADAVVHLAGENIADGRWSQSHKTAIMQSRVQGTELLAGAVASLTEPPEAFVCASGIDYYGDRGDEWVDEDDGPGNGFLPEVCQKWEEACQAARQVSRVVNTRFSMVLSSEGGALDKMLTPFKWGVGGRLGDGHQYMSWVALRDLVRAVVFVIEESDLEGPVNVTSPNPVTNREFTDAMGEALSRPTPFPVPSPMLKMAVGAQLADEMLLKGQRARPKRLAEAGFEFEHTDIGETLNALL